MNNQSATALTRRPFSQRFGEWLKAYAQDVSQSPMERLWQRVDRLERELEQLKTTRTR
jgi:hypothetical protein